MYIPKLARRCKRPDKAELFCQMAPPPWPGRRAPGHVLVGKRTKHIRCNVTAKGTQLTPWRVLVAFANHLRPTSARMRESNASPTPRTRRCNKIGATPRNLALYRSPAASVLRTSRGATKASEKRARPFWLRTSRPGSAAETRSGGVVSHPHPSSAQHTSARYLVGSPLRLRAHGSDGLTRAQGGDYVGFGEHTTELAESVERVIEKPSHAQTCLPRRLRNQDSG